MAIALCSRYGEQTLLVVEAALAAAIRELVGELCQEQQPRPDFEHSEISITLESGLSIAATVRGIVALYGQGEPRYLYGLARSDLEAMFISFAVGEFEFVHSQPWQGTIPAAVRHDLYLFASRPDLTNLHRAAAKGDCPWIQEELEQLTAINARDQNGATALHWAAHAGQFEACRLLLDRGADRSAVDDEGVTAQEYAEMSEEYLSANEVRELVDSLR